MKRKNCRESNTVLVFGLFAMLFGIGVLMNSESAIHEILSLIAFLVFAVAWIGSYIISFLHTINLQLGKPRTCPHCGESSDEGEYIHVNEDLHDCPKCHKPSRRP